MNFRFSDEKNRRLSETRRVTFEDVIEAIAEHGVLAEYGHPNQEKYPGQRIMVVRINDYPTVCPSLSMAKRLTSELYTQVGGSAT